MSKIVIELSPQQITEAIEKLPKKDKLKITEKLERETLALRWRKILKDISARLKKFPISQREVLQEIRAYRKAKYA